MPAPCCEFWNAEYPATTGVEACLEMIRSRGYTAVGHFALPALSWWTDYYGPLQAAIERVRPGCAGDEEAMALADALQPEIDIWREYRDCYGYVFFVMRR